MIASLYILINMSLFKLKPLVSKAFPDQEFDQQHLAVGNLGQKPVLALANFQGLLRLFLIARNKEIQLQSIYQNNFESSIVAVQFVSHPDDHVRGSVLGVLLFRKFAFISFKQVDDRYEAKLLFIQTEPAFGICASPLSVMTLNSSIQSLNPREISKLKAADPIYPFASQLSKLYFMDGEELVEMESGTEQWRIILGRVRQLFVIAETVVAIGERALWEVAEAKIVKTKMMDEEISYGSITFCNSHTYNLVVANFSGQLFVYSSDYELLWAVKLDYVPVKVIVCQHPTIKGMIVLLSDEGGLELAYSGVDVPESVIEPISEKVDFSVVESETCDFLQRMDEKGSQVQKKQETSSLRGGYKLYFGQIEKSIKMGGQKEGLYESEGRLVKVPLVCEITSPQNLKNVKIQLNLAYNLYCEQQVKDLRVAKNKDKIIFHLYTSSESFPSQKQISVMVRYDHKESKGAPFVKLETMAIPIALQSTITAFQVKDTFPNKIIIKSNIELPAFNHLFPELIPQGTPEQRKSIRFTLSNGVQCVVAYNKGFNKAKVESQYYSGLCYIVSEFSTRIQDFNRKNCSKIDLSVQIPLEEFFGIMKEHYEHRVTLKKAFKQVELRSEEFRNTEKKLLVKMKEKMTRLGSVDKLLEYTYDRLMESADQYEEALQRMDIINHNLSVAITFIIELLFIRSNPSEKARRVAVGILGYEKETLEQGWQNKVLANSSHYLNKKHNNNDEISFQHVQKIPLYVISKINNGDWN